MTSCWHKRQEGIIHGVILYDPPTGKDPVVKESGGTFSLCWGQLRIHLGAGQTEARRSFEKLIACGHDLMRNKPLDLDEWDWEDYNGKG